MIKKLFIILGVIVLLAIVAIFAIGFFISPIVTKSINTLGPRITGTKVELGSANISLLTGSGSLKNLFVGNPEGWSSDKAFELGEVRLKVEPSSLFSHTLVIDEIFIDGPQFVYETNLRSSNIAALQKQIETNLEKFTGGSKTPEAGAPAETETLSKKKFIVRQFRLQGGKVSLGLGAASIPVVMPPVTINDIGVKEGGVTADQLASAISKAVLSGVTKAGSDAILQGGVKSGDALKDAAKGATEGLKNLFGK